MNKLTIPSAKRYIRENYGQERQNISILVKAIRKISKAEGVNPLDLFFLIIENKPMAMTHSYGFHTRYGRHLIDTTISTYYQIERSFDEEQVIIF